MGRNSPYSSYGKWEIDPEEWGVTDFAEPQEPDRELSEDGFTPTAPEDVKTTIKEGDLFEIRKGAICHRLLCGDSRKIEDVRRLMGGMRADCIVTDPPYNVDYASKNEYLNNTDRGNRIQIDIKNDNMADADFTAFWPIYTLHFMKAASRGRLSMFSRRITGCTVYFRFYRGGISL